MTNKEITSLAIQLGAIYIFIQAIVIFAGLGSVLNAYFEGAIGWSLLIPIFAVLGLFIVSFSLWKLSTSVVNNMTINQVVNDDFKVDQIFILNLVGFYVVVISLFGLIQAGISLVNMYFVQEQEYQANYIHEISPQSIFYIVANIIKLILGVTLIIKPIGWTHFFNKFRTLGKK